MRKRRLEVSIAVQLLAIAPLKLPTFQSETSAPLLKLTNPDRGQSRPLTSLPHLDFFLKQVLQFVRLIDCDQGIYKLV
jgi:hypothetical protein